MWAQVRQVAVRLCSAGCLQMYSAGTSPLRIRASATTAGLVLALQLCTTPKFCSLHAIAACTVPLATILVAGA